MQAAGYGVDPPTAGQELIETIMGRKAIGEFRWTTVDRSSRKAESLKQVSREEYEKLGSLYLSPKVRKRMTTLGKPPRRRDERRAASRHGLRREDLVTGVRSTCQCGGLCTAQTRLRGARCDGQVCKVLHDPDIRPHQYMATIATWSGISIRGSRLSTWAPGNLEHARQGRAPPIVIRTSPSAIFTSTSTMRTTPPGDRSGALHQPWSTICSWSRHGPGSGLCRKELEELGTFLEERERDTGLGGRLPRLCAFGRRSSIPTPHPQPR